MEIQEFITEAEHLRRHLLSQAKHYLGDADSAEDAAQELSLIHISEPTRP